MKIFIGYDKDETDAFNVCKYSIEKYQSKNNEIIKLDRHELIFKGIYNREKETGATDFAFTRFLVPYLSGFKEEPVLFVDCDFLFFDDVNKLEQYWDKDKALSVCKFPNYQPPTAIKMNGAKQIAYKKKNWSSLMLFNPYHYACRWLMPNFVNTKSGEVLHRFFWVNEEDIGELPFDWNTLNGYTDLYIKLKKDHGWKGNVSALHYTDGGPWFDQYKDCVNAEIWNEVLNEYREHKCNN